MTFILWAVLKDVEVAIELFVKLADRGEVFEAVAVVWGRPHCGEHAVKQLLVAFLAYLVRSVDSDATVRMQEPLHNVCAEKVTCSSIGELEALCV